MASGSLINRWRLRIRIPGPAIYGEDWCCERTRNIFLTPIFPALLVGKPVAGMTCTESNDAWPLGTDVAALGASFAPFRNYFSGELSPGVGKLTTTPPFYSAAAIARDQITWWLLSAVDGTVHLLDGVTDQVVEQVGWGSDIAGVRSGCGAGWQVLATGSGDTRGDAVQAFEIVGREPVPASAPLDMSGPVTALWTESGETSAVAVVHNWETGRYEAFRLTLTCGR